MLSRFFVDRPIFAWVVAIVIMLAGLLSIFNLPVSQYPRIAPPQVTVSATYPGASAETMSRTVTQIIEQNMTGLDGLLYMSSTSDSTGRMTITLTFEAGTILLRCRCRTSSRWLSPRCLRSSSVWVSWWKRALRPS